VEIEKELFASATITGKRQITIPKELNDMLGLKTGDKVIFREWDKKIIFEKDVYSMNPELTLDKSSAVNFVIPFTDVSDLKRLKEIPQVEGIFDMAKNTLKNGGKVILKKEYTNAPPEIMKVYNTQEEFEDFEAKFLAVE
jgi:AbrB family looped-hinge helix DNA binding protein